MPSRVRLILPNEVFFMTCNITSIITKIVGVFALVQIGFDSALGYQEGAIPIAAVQRDKPVDFNSDILPILQRNCVACHNQQDNQGGLLLETPESMRKGGDNGPALLPNRGDDSLMLKYAAHQMEPVMPPKGNDVNAKSLTSEELGLLRLWINQGAQGTITTVNLSPKSMRNLPARLAPIYSLDLTDDGQYLAIARSNRLFIAHVPTGRIVANLGDPLLSDNASGIATPFAHKDLIQSLAFNLEGDLLASGSFREVKLWRRPSDVKMLDIPTGVAITATAITPDRKWIVIGNMSGQIQLYDASNGQPGIKISAHTGKITALRFAADGRLLSASQDQTIRCWNLHDGSPSGLIETPSAIHSIELSARPPSPENNAPNTTTVPDTLVSAGADQMVRTWTLPSVPTQPTHVTFQNALKVAFSADQIWMALAFADGSIQMLRSDEAGNYKLTFQWKVATEAVQSLAFFDGKRATADGKSLPPYLATLSQDGTVSLHDIEKQTLIMSWRSLAGTTGTIASSKDGKWLATGGNDGLIRLWSAEAVLQNAVEVMLGSKPSAFAINTARSAIAVSGTSDGAQSIKIVETETGKITHTLTGHAPLIRAVHFSADGTRVLAGTEDKALLLWNLGDPANTMPRKIEGLSAAVTAVAFSPDAAQALVGTTDNMVYLYNLSDGMQIQKFAGHGGPIIGVGYSAQVPFSISSDRTIRFWNPADASQTRAFNDQATTLAWNLSSDGNLLALAGDDKNIRLYQIANGQLMQTLTGHTAPCSSLNFAADGKKLVSTALLGDKPSESIVWDLSGQTPRIQEILLEKEVQWSFFDGKSDRLWLESPSGLFRRTALRLARYLEGGPNQPLRALNFHSNGQILFTASQDGTLRGYQTANGQPAFNTSHGAAVTAMCLSPDESLLATTAENGSLRIWQNNGNPFGIQQIQGLKGLLQSIAISHDNQFVIVACKGDKPSLQVYDITTGKLVQQFSDHASVALSVAIALPKNPSQDNSKRVPSRLIAISTESIWSNELLGQRVIAGHTGEVWTLSAMPGEPRQIWSGAADGTIRLWNLDNGQAIRQINHGGSVLAIAIRPDGQRLASVSENKTAKLWQINGQQVAELKGDLRAKTQVARSTYQQTSANAAVTVGKQRLDVAEKDVPIKQEAEKKATEALAAADKTLGDKKGLVDKAGNEKMAAEKEAIDSAAAARNALVQKNNAEKAYKTAVTSAESAQQQSNQLAALANASPADATLKTAAEQAAMKLTAAQQSVQQSQAAMQAPSEAFNNASNVANTAAQKVTTLQKPFNDAKAELIKATADRNLAFQQHEIAVRESKVSQEKVPALRAVFAEAELAATGAKTRLETAQKTLLDSELPIRSVAFSEDGTTLLTGGDYPNLHSWDAETGTPIAVYAGHTAALNSVSAFDSERWISSSADGSLKVWQRNPPWQLERTIGSVDQLDLIQHRVLSLDFNPDSSQLLIAGGVPSRDGELQIFSVANGSKVTRFTNIHSDVIHAARFSPDGKRIATASADKYARTIDAATGQILLRFEGHTNYVLSVAWKGDGQTLVTSGADNAIKVWEVATADQKRTIDNGFSKAITKVEYIGETDNIVSCSGDRSVRFHNAENGGNIRNFNGAKAWLHSVDVSADGSIVATGGEDGKVLIWNGNNSQLLHTLEFSN